MNPTVWIIEEFYNDYDQHGGYLVAVFSREPTEKDLSQFGYTYFGRQNDTYRWVEKSNVEIFV